MVYNRILEVRKCMDRVYDLDIDLSRKYNLNSEIEKENCEIQLDLMLFTRSIYNRWDSCYKYDTKRILYLC